jgi:hypothetical protein
MTSSSSSSYSYSSKNRYFHGDISGQQAELALTTGEKVPGTFLLRFSTRDPGLYCISVLESNMKVRHYRIIHKAGLGFRLGNTERATLQELLQLANKQLNLVRPCAGSPFQMLWRSSLNSSDGVPDYAQPDI